MTDESPAGASDAAPHSGGRRIGPFTAIQWGAILLGGVGLGILIKRHTTASAAPADLNTSTAPAVANGSTVANGAVPLVDGTAPGGSTASTSAPTTNQDWQIAALNYLVANNFGSPSDIQRALGDFMAGNPLTPQEKSVIDEAITHLGAPPEFVPPETDAPVAVAPTPDPPTVPAPPAAPAPPAQTLSPNLSPEQLNGIQAYLGAAYNLIARYKNGENTMPAMAAMGIKVSDLQNNGCTPAQVQLYRVVCQQNGFANLANS